jgi:hypothetical protein
MLTTDNVDPYIARMQSFMERRFEILMTYTEEEVRTAQEQEENDDDDDSNDVLYTHYRQTPSTFYTMTGFTVSEFDRLYQMSQSTFVFKGRGRRSKISPRDIMYILLNYIRRYPRIEEMAASINLKPSTLSKLLTRAVPVASSCWSRLFVIKPSLDGDFYIDQAFPETCCIVDATVQQINTPTGDFDDQKAYFSGKHHIYCLKSQVVTDMKGAALHVHAGVPGATHDLEVFRQTLPELTLIMDHHEDITHKIAGDKGYQSGDIECLVTPHKGKPENLTRPEKLFNERINKARVVVENFFGRLKSRYAIVGSKYRGDHEHYEAYFKLCCALVNYEIRQCGHSLRREDGDYYRRFLCHIKNIEEEKERKLREKRLQQRENRLRRNSDL